MKLSAPQIIALVALTLGVLTNGITDPSAYGISEVAKHWIAIVAQIASTIAAYLVVPKDRDAANRVSLKERK